MFVTKLRIEKIPNTIHWTVLEPLRWEGFISVHVPAGFKTDLTTRWFEGRHTEASVLHDFLLVNGYGFAVSNQVMYEAMIDLDVPVWRRRVIMAGVTVWGWINEGFK